MTIDYENIALSYKKYGEGKENIVILPGWGETRNTFLEMINILKIDYTVYIIDYPGFGDTPFPNYNLTMDDYTLLIIDFFKKLNITNPNIIAHSFGGRIAILLSAKYHISIKNLILIDSAGIIPKLTLKKKLRLKLYKTLQSLANRLPNNIRKKAKAYLFNKFSSSDYQALDENMRETFKNIVNLDLTNYLSKIKCNTLILWGEKDIDTPLKDGKLMHKKITNSELIIFPNCTHFCYLENTYVIIKIILCFLDS